MRCGMPMQHINWRLGCQCINYSRCSDIATSEPQCAMSIGSIHTKKVAVRSVIWFPNWEASMNPSADLQTLMCNELERYRTKRGMTSRQRQVCEHIKCCRTPAMGGHQLACSACDFSAPRYHSCRDRHCPKCQRAASKQWCERQRENLLPVTYHHLVFTLPSSLNHWVSLYPDLIYHQLFQCAWKTLRTMGADPKRLNGQMGLTAVLHTWGENLSRHVHLHCLVPGGALGLDGQWHNARSNYLFPVRALSRIYRAQMVSALKRASKAGLMPSTALNEVNQKLDLLMEKQWVVYSKPCPTKTRTVVDYLGRYSHRIAISDQRIRSIDNGKVCFSTKDYTDNGTRKDTILSADEFIRRYLLHVLPKGVMRIRHYGFLSNRTRKKKLACLRTAISRGATQNKPLESTKPTVKPTCPQCKQGQMYSVDYLLPKRLTEA